VGIVCTLGLFVLDWLPESVATLHLVMNQGLFIVAMMFLRISVMNNNALLSSFPKSKITALSLTGNLLGFSVNLVGLLVLALIPSTFIPERVIGVTRENWLLLMYTGITIVVSLLTWYSPTGANNKVEEERLPMREVLKNTIASMISTITRAKEDTQYFQCWIYLFAYLFFSTAGTVVTIFLAPLFIAIYDLHLQDEVLLNLYYKIAMVIGVFLGMFLDRCFRLNELLTLTVQNIVFGVLLIITFFCVQFQAPYLLVLFLVLFMGLLYAWNASVARGCFSKLIPKEKACEFMGFYSTFTYLGISIVSGLNAIIHAVNLPTQSLLLMLFFWILPAYIFLFILFVSIRKQKQASVVEQ
jgi:MFS-type transporter involved in bile tolerance (Atg22 family)